MSLGVTGVAMVQLEAIKMVGWMSILETENLLQWVGSLVVVRMVIQEVQKRVLEQ
jgi:hypothetical protein